MTLCDPVDCSLPASSVHGILQTRILEWVAMPSSRGSSQPGIEPASLLSTALAGEFFTTSATWEALFNYKKLNFINGMNIAHEIERTMARRRKYFSHA